MRETGVLLVTTYENNSELSAQIFKEKVLLAIVSKPMLALLMKMADMNNMKLPSIPHTCYSIIHSNDKSVINLTWLLEL
jgi:hypothetical protein